MTEAIAEASARVRAGVGLFDMDDRGLLEVRGSDRIRWLDGMITADVEALERRGEGAGAAALLLTHRGAIVADLHVGRIGDALLLECAREACLPVREALERRIIADDVVLTDHSEAYAVLGVEGVGAEEVLARAIEDAGIPAREGWARVRVAATESLVAGFGWSGERAFQIRTEPDARDRVRAALEQAARALDVDCVRGDRSLLDLLRIESGIPALGSELDEDVLPPEARLERSIAVNKGCYVGQEIVARLRSRGQVNHLLVGLRLDGDAGAAAGGGLSVAGRTTGELTSVVRSPSQGWIALAYVRREHAEPGTAIEIAGGGSARVVALPFVPPASGSSSPPTASSAPDRLP
ncbi:MAG: glycine cleavage T C-terminal barrel domain-containing protein [Myxococcota bacterium]